MRLTLTGYRLHDKKRKDQRTIVAMRGTDEVKFREQIRSGELMPNGEPYKGRLTPQYARSS